ncbi:hypothetical protein DFJ74DRAFT_663127 [Hyaloraphidium curvatum]|nr:hypothetical protein DFJ74DRAFT_663127 [Hyaloraphidium curvatum]
MDAVICAPVGENHEQRRTCEMCGRMEAKRDVQEVFKRCSRCKQAFYCNAECQHEHWAFHKEHCSDYDAVLRPVEERLKPFVVARRQEAKEAMDREQSGQTAPAGVDLDEVD